MTQPESTETATEKPALAGQDVAYGTIPTNFNHRGFTLVGTTFVVFEGIFLTLYGSDFWFDWDLSLFGIPTIIFAAVISHILLLSVESKYGCIFFSPIWKGCPPTVYWRLVSTTSFGITFGARHMKWEAVDELFLTFLGNLLVRSRMICGKEAREADLLAKIPVGTVPTDYQRRLVESVRSKNPDLKTNRRLDKRLQTKDLKGTAFIQSFGVIFMILILLDLGRSTFAFLEMNKDYFLSQLRAKDGKVAEAKRYLAAADSLHEHPFPVSWVDTKLLRQGVVAAGVHQLRSEALWRLDRKDEAIEEAKKAIESSPDSFRMNLRLARLYADTGKLSDCRQQIRKAIKNHNDSLLPRLYMLAELAAEHNNAQLSSFYQIYLDEMIDLVYGEEPNWPPGGNRFLHEVFFSEDVTFVFDRLLKNHNESTDEKR